ncbi:lysylphosphatidylglycerol synthase domain-containing protein [Geoglobus acetivorans]
MRLRLAVGLALVVMLVFLFRDSLQYLLSANPVYFFYGVVFYVLLNLILSFRIHYLLVKSGQHSDFIDVMKAHFAGMILGDFTPGRVGYFSAPLFAQRYGMNADAFMGVILSSQAVELVVKIFGASLAVVYFLKPEEVYLLALPAILTVAAILYLWSDIPPDIGRLREIRIHARKTARHTPFIVLISLAGWLLTGLQWYYLFLSARIDAGFVQAMLIQPLATLLMFVPLTPAGLGVFESGSALLVSAISSNLNAGVAHSILVRVSTVAADLPGLAVIMEKRGS